VCCAARDVPTFGVVEGDRQRQWLLQLYTTLLQLYTTLLQLYTTLLQLYTHTVTTVHPHCYNCTPTLLQLYTTLLQLYTTLLQLYTHTESRNIK
jgi:hypothetical protein